MRWGRQVCWTLWWGLLIFFGLFLYPKKPPEFSTTTTRSRKNDNKRAGCSWNLGGLFFPKVVVVRKQKQKLKETEHFLAFRLSFFRVSGFSSNSSLQVVSISCPSLV
jgi:hypothetical protein